MHTRLRSLSRRTPVPALTLLLALNPALPAAHASLNLHGATAPVTSYSFTVDSTVDAPDVNPGDGICADAAGKCTVRAATQEASALPGGSTIAIAVPAGTYGLTLGTLQLTANSIAISGALSSTTIISGNNTSTIMAIASKVQASLSGVTITGGNGGLVGGGGIYNQGMLTVSSSTIMGNTTGSGGVPINGGNGGGIWSSGPLRVTTSTVNGNSTGSGAHGGSGGGIWSSGRLALTASTVGSNITGNGDNTAFGLPGGGGGDGGGIWSSGRLNVSTSIISSNVPGHGGSSLGGRGGRGGNGGGIWSSGPLRVTATIISSNTTGYGGGGTRGTGYGGDGGGIFNQGSVTLTGSTVGSNTTGGGSNGGDGAGIWSSGLLRVASSTISSNTTSGIGHGGGIKLTGGTATLAYSTVASNSDGIANNGGTIVLTGTIVANSTPGANCTGAITEGHGYNLDSGTSCSFSKPSDINSHDPMLGPLADNGGPTQTMALLTGSPAIDEGGPHVIGCPLRDQRGMARPDEPMHSAACDMGAYESQGVG